MSTPVNIVSIEFGIPPLSLTNEDVVTVIVKDATTGAPLSDILEVNDDHNTIELTVAQAYTANDWVTP